MSTSFHGTVLGMAHKPLGQIILAMIFEEGDKFRHELCTFEVIGSEMVYNALLGTPHIAQFMAIPNYTYMMVKLPGPSSVIIVRGSPEHAVECGRQSYNLAAG